MKPADSLFRKIELLAGMLATVLIATGLLVYTFQEPERLVTAQAAQVQSDLDSAMSLYAENCAVCHGLSGEGLGAAPPLNSAALRDSDPASLAKIIARGLYATSMPAWSKEDGGPLSDYQINQLVTLILAGDWQQTQDRVVNMGLAPQVPFNTEPDPQIVAGLAALPDGEPLALGVQLYAENCVACHGPDGTGTALAPALNDPDVRAQETADLQRVLSLGSSGTLMAGWQKSLLPEEMDALLALIKRWDEVPSGAIPAPETPVAVTAESLALGQDLYSSSCSRCHGPDGQGTQRAPALNVKSFLEETPDLAIQQIITLGVPGTAMPAWGDRLTDAEIQAVVGFVRSWEPDAPEVAEPARGGGGPWWQTGSSQSSGRGGGPPWQNNSSSSSTTDQNSSGQLSSASMSADTSSDISPATIVAPDANVFPDASTSPDISASTADAAALPAFTPSAATTDQAAGHVGSGPPWTQADPPETSWIDLLDQPARLLIGALTGSSLLLILAGMVMLRRLPPP
jgi:mono/diheme cytochrome c family protein